MPIASIVFGGLLIALGVWGYITPPPEKQSWTALIPAFVGGFLVLLGALGLVERMLKHAMHAAAVIGLLGVLGGVGKAIEIVVKKKDLADKPGISSLSMAGLCALFVALCVNSFIQARRRRRAAALVGEVKPGPQR
jgi:hypothetical protein